MKTLTKIVMAGALAATVAGSGIAFARNGGPGPGPNPGMRMYERLCIENTRHFDPAKMAERVSKRLDMNDAQKKLFDDLQAAFAKSHDDLKAAICADKPDFSTMPSRAAFAIKTLDARLAGMKTVQPKLEAFYASLSDQQKQIFDNMHPHRRGGGRWNMQGGPGKKGPADNQ